MFIYSTYKYLFILGPEIIRSALSPGLSIKFNDKNQISVVWLDKHFEVNYFYCLNYIFQVNVAPNSDFTKVDVISKRATGDVSPNSDFTKVDVTCKKELYNKYVKDTANHGKPVTMSRFYELWSTLFPWSINRPWCNIPGKCDPCYEIQRGALESRFQDSYTQELFKKCHAIHRGGMFNLERAQ
jgi:hypothetical protein